MSGPDIPEAEAFTFEGDPAEGLAGMTRIDLRAGTMDECLAAVWSLSDELRDMAYIVTDGWTYVSDEIEAMRRKAGIGGPAGE
ncbi:MAG: hypothetical protein PGN09_07490 [Sphingomonas fennica]